MKKVDINLPDSYKYDELVGESCPSPRVVVGEQALSRTGLTSFMSSMLQLSTLYTDITGLTNFICTWYFNPFADRYEFTRPSHKHPNILIPTRERAICEYILLKDYFNEGILIEGIQNYLWHSNNDVSKLYEVGKHFYVNKELIDYWVNEAIEDGNEG